MEGADAIPLLSCLWGHPAHTYITKVSSSVLPRQGVGVILPSVAAGERRGQLSSSSDLNEASPTYTRLEEHGWCQRGMGRASLPFVHHHMVDEG